MQYILNIMWFGPIHMLLCLFNMCIIFVSIFISCLGFKSNFRPMQGCRVPSVLSDRTDRTGLDRHFIWVFRDPGHHVADVMCLKNPRSFFWGFRSAMGMHHSAQTGKVRKSLMFLFGHAQKVWVASYCRKQSAHGNDHNTQKCLNI